MSNSADPWWSGGVIGDTYTVMNYGEVNAEDIISYEGILYRNVNGATDESQTPDQDATNWEAITQDSDTTLTETKVDDFVANNGYLTSETDDQTLSLSGTTLSIEDGGPGVDLSSIDTDTKLTEAEVDTFVANNGYLTSETDDQTLSSERHDT